MADPSSRKRPYLMPETDWKRDLLQGFLRARVDNLMFESSLSIADDRTSEHTDSFWVTGRVELGEGFKGMRIWAEVRSTPSVVFHDQDPPFLGVGLLHFLSKDQVRRLHEPRADQLPETLHEFQDQLQKASEAEDLLEARVYAETRAYEGHRRILVEGVGQPNLRLHLSMEVVGLFREWTRSSPLVITHFSIISRTPDFEQ